ncbi:TPA: hypothetical protein ACWL94_004561, partial [Escherichia coli]
KLAVPLIKNNYGQYLYKMTKDSN